MLTLNGSPLPAGQDVMIGEFVYSYATLLNMSEAERADLGVTDADPEPPTLAEAKAARLQELADRRWAESQTFDYDGVTTQADPAIPAVTAAVVSSQFLPANTVRTWKLATGEYRQWTNAHIVAFGMAISAHIQACFDREAALSAAISSAADIDSLLAIQLDGWPE